jgi:hypothetical protein
MPKDNEVDEKVMPVAWIVTNGGESCEPWLEYEQSEVDALPAVCIAEPLYSAATVAELRAEVEKARIAGIDACDKLTALWQKDIDRADAAERRVGELVAAASKIKFTKMGEAFVASAEDIADLAIALTGADPT